MCQSLKSKPVLPQILINSNPKSKAYELTRFYDVNLGPAIILAQ
jgi:hypothetical protein